MPTPLHTIIQLSDTHIVPEGELLHGSQDTIQHVAAVLTALQESGLSPDALLLTGDLADTGRPEAYARLRALVEPAAERIGCPVLYAMGNHDERIAFRAGLLPGEGAVDYVHMAGDLRIIVLDSTVPGHHHGELSAAQLDWLRAELATPAPAGTIVALHHPPIPSPLALLDMVGLNSAAELADAVRGSDVRMILAGHAHHASAGTLAGVPVWVAGAVAYSSDTLAPAGAFRGLPGATFTRVDLYEDHTVATVVPVSPQSVQPLYEITAEQLEKYMAQSAAAAQS
ncbi:metallophosphoesterase [Spongiactinospora sp. 9N601]|uniref:metallophosphoesterase n=1 Tax=Spongiactinospora sp. 9N601 TaxID=3375149 RepID=UPI0037A9BDFA